MKHSGLTHKFWARAVAFGLFCLLAAALAGSIYGMAYCASHNWYDADYNNHIGYDGDVIWQRVFRMRWYLPYIAGAAVLMEVILLVFLLRSAGRREGQEGFHLGWQDKLPLDLYLCAMGPAALLLFVCGYDVVRWGASITALLLLMPLAAGLALVVMAALMTLAARIKHGKWWRNTVIYWLWTQLKRVCARLGRLVAGFFRLFDRVRMSWRYALGFGVFILVNAILAIGLLNGMGGASVMCFVLLVLWNGLALAALLYCLGQMQRLKDAGEALAAGNLGHQVALDKLRWDFKAHGESLNSIGEGIARAVEERIRSERFRTELITNVSHDIKTPLTSIVTYTQLLKQEEIPNEKAAEYIDTIDRHAQKLKKLTEDLLEASKASSGAINVNMERVNICELMRQTLAEYGERLSGANITPVAALPEEDIYIQADGRLLWRVFDNLMLNICRHGMAGTRAYLTAGQKGSEVRAAFKNISAQQLNIPAEELLERFVQGDGSRSKEGSGLGLSIAWSLTELMGGALELTLDGDLFKAELVFDAQEKAQG